MSVGTIILLDVFKEHQMLVGHSMNVVFFVGSSVGPVIGGQVAEQLGLKWIFLISGIACGAIGLSGMICFRETNTQLIRYKIHQRQNLDDRQQYHGIHDFHEFSVITVMTRALSGVYSGRVLSLVLPVYAGL